MWRRTQNQEEGWEVQMDPRVKGELYIVAIPLTVKEGGLGGDKGM